MNICEYGCGKEGLYQIGKKGKWCCSERYYDCVGRRKKLSDNRIGKWSGDNNPSKNPVMVEKRRLSYIEHYGVEHPMFSDEVKEIVKHTNLEKYGDSSPSKTKEVKERIRKTQIEKYGEWYTKTDEYKQKSIETSFKKYGVESPNQSDDVKEKKKLSNIENWGVENVFQNEEIKELSKKTMKEKYGVEYNLQRAEIPNGYKWKKYTLPSGRIINIQGYEDKALDELLLIYNENDILVENADISNEIGSINYIFEGKRHRYFPDIYIKSQKKVIEVKSMYTLKSNFDKNMAKRNACISSGLNFEFKVF